MEYNDRVQDQEQERQMAADMIQMRIDHTFELGGLISEARFAKDLDEFRVVLSRISTSLAPLLDAAYGPLRNREVRPITFRRLMCVICGSDSDARTFCNDCRTSFSPESLARIAANVAK